MLNAGVSSGSSSASGNLTANIAPPGSACINRPRAATMARASSKENTPAITAATNSPMLCPIIDAGLIPQLIHSVASAYSTLNIAG